MITRHAVEQQADQCFMYHVGAYAATLAGLALTGHRSFGLMTGLWGSAVALHGALLYGTPATREKILLWTAEGMEERQRLMDEVTAMTEPTAAGH